MDEGVLVLEFAVSEDARTDDPRRSFLLWGPEGFAGLFGFLDRAAVVGGGVAMIVELATQVVAFRSVSIYTSRDVLH